MSRDRDLYHLEPSVRHKLHEGIAVYERTRTRELVIVVTETWRDSAAQLEAQVSGKSRRPPGRSYHNVTRHGKPWAYAFDFMLRDKDGHLLPGESHADELAYREAGEAFKSVGFRWSGDWKGDLHEVGHCEAPIASVDRAWAGEDPQWPGCDE